MVDTTSAAGAHDTSDSLSRHRSVWEMRADGWIIPSLAYATAFTVALDRINDTKHYASDVFTGAAIGVVTGRFIVNRHRELRDESGKLFVELLPIRDGISARLRF